MQEQLTNISFTLDSTSLAKAARIAPGTDDDNEFRALVDQARRMAKPKAIYRECFIQDKGEDSVKIDGVTFVSRTLRLNLDKVERVFAYVATCGNELDRIDIPGDDFLKRFWLDNIKTLLLGFGIGYLNEYLGHKYKLGKTVSMNPGSGDARIWPIEQQKGLFSLFGDVEKLIGVCLTDTCLMIPNKSVSGVRFQTEINFQSCQVCRRESCVGRKAPFDPALWKKVNNKQ
jgi:hypothetical protein